MRISDISLLIIERSASSSFQSAIITKVCIPTIKPFIVVLQTIEAAHRMI